MVLEQYEKHLMSTGLSYIISIRLVYVAQLEMKVYKASTQADELENIQIVLYPNTFYNIREICLIVLLVTTKDMFFSKC